MGFDTNLKEKAFREITQRNRASSGGSLVLFFLFYVAGGVASSPSGWLAGSLGILFNVLRLILGTAPPGSRRFELWRRFHPLLILGAALGWATLGSWVFSERGINDFGGQMMLVLLSGVSASTLVSMAAIQWLFQSFLAILIFIPTATILVVERGKPSWVYPLIFLAYFFFLRRQGLIYSKNLTENFRYQRRMEEDRNELKTILDAVPGYISYLNKDLEYVSMNQRLKAALKLGEDRYIGQKAGSVTGDTPWSRELEEFSRSGQPALFKELELSITGEPRWYLVCFRRAEQGNWIVSISIDIHQQKMLHLESQSQKAQIEYSAKMAALGEMAGGIAHEINNPLSVISGYAAQLRSKLEPLGIRDDRFEKGLLKIEDTVMRIARIVKGLLSFSRSSHSDPKEAKLVAEIIQETVELCGERFRKNSVDLKINCPARLSIDCRPGEIGQVFLNLLNNAFDAIQPHADKWVLIDVTEQELFVRIHVEDCGNGIPKPVAEKMMQPFFSTKEVGRGTGLGLSISKGIIEQHDGRFFYDDTAANTRFVIELPKTTRRADLS